MAAGTRGAEGAAAPPAAWLNLWTLCPSIIPNILDCCDSLWLIILIRNRWLFFSCTSSEIRYCLLELEISNLKKWRSRNWCNYSFVHVYFFVCLYLCIFVSCHRMSTWQWGLWKGNLSYYCPSPMCNRYCGLKMYSTPFFILTYQHHVVQLTTTI